MLPMPDFSVGRSGLKLRFPNDYLKISLYQVHNENGWLFETWVKENPICYERNWTECFFKNKQMKSCLSAELCYNKYLNGLSPRNQNDKK
jgi:hypothetical protein